MARISIVGLGKLGACMAAVYASKGNDVIGIDINSEYVSRLNSGEPPVIEKDLASFISLYKNRISATGDYEKAIRDTDITFIIVPTPSNSDGFFSTEYIEKACKSIGKELAKKESYHLVIVTSTVLPGDCEEKIIPILEKNSQKRCGESFGFCYSPEFIAIGSVIYDLLHPDFYLIGEYDKRSGDVLDVFYQTVSEASCPVRRMSIPSAELTKISVNSFLTMKITYGNMLAELAERIKGVNVDDVAGALGSDKRIGRYYIHGGLGYGGPCFPRDNRAFAAMAKKIDVHVPYAEATDTYNQHIIERSVQKIMAATSKEENIGIIGLSYKPGTYFAEESQAVSIAKNLATEGYTVHVFDPEGTDHAKTYLHDVVVYDERLDFCLDSCSTIFLSNKDKANELVLEMVNRMAKPIKIIDPWRQFRPDQFSAFVEYICFGIGI